MPFRLLARDLSGGIVIDIFQSSDDDVERAIVKGNITREQALKAVHGWWHSWLIARGLKRRGQIVKCDFQYVPYWRVRAKVDGFVVGNVAKGSKCRYYKREKSTVVGSITWTGIATDQGDVGIGYLKKPEIEASPDAGSIGPRLDVTVSKDAMIDRCETDVDNSIAERMRIERDGLYSPRLNVSPVDTLIIYYPLWTVRYVYGETDYVVTVDGVTGAVLAGKAPGDPLLRKLCLATGLTAGISTIVSFIWAYLFRHDCICGVMILGFIGAIIAWYTLGYYLYGKEVRRGARWTTWRRDQERQSVVINALKTETISSVLYIPGKNV